jgi:hypothetical protein
MIPKYNFPDHIKGDTLPNKNINFGFDLSGAVIQMNFKIGVNSPVAFFWSTEDNSISIANGLTGSINMNAKIIDAAPATYKYDCQIKFANGRVKTYFNGTLTIVQDITV